MAENENGISTSNNNKYVNNYNNEERKTRKNK